MHIGAATRHVHAVLSLGRDAQKRFGRGAERSGFEMNLARSAGDGCILVISLRIAGDCAEASASFAKDTSLLSAGASERLVCQPGVLVLEFALLPKGR